MAIPTVSWNETTPADSALRSEGDDRIRELKTQLREIIAVDHVMASSGSDTDWGFHNKVTLKVQGSAPTAVADCMLLYAKDVSAKAELFMRNEDGTEMQLTSAGNFIAGMINEIRMWSGTLATIPNGWSLCDGTSGKPDLLTKFIRGVATSATNPGGTGGAETVTLAEANLPTHSHTLNYHTAGAGPLSGLYGGLTTGTVAGDDSSTQIGNSTPFSIIPTYYALAYIIKV